jgi:hypothetical protein
VVVTRKSNTIAAEAMNKTSRRYSINTVWNTTRNGYLADVGVAPLALEDPNHATHR